MVITSRQVHFSVPFPPPPRCPRGCCDITTVPVAEGREPCEDEVGADGFLRYRYRRTDVRHRHNVGLRRAMEQQVPLLYLHGTVPGWYRPEWPVFIVGEILRRSHSRSPWTIPRRFGRIYQLT